MAENFEHGPIGTVVRAPNGRLYLVTSHGARELSQKQTHAINRLLDDLVISITREAANVEIGSGIGGDPSPVTGREPGPIAAMPMNLSSGNTSRCVAVNANPVFVNPPPPPS